MSNPTEELLDVVDTQDRVLRTATRDEVYRDRLTHRCAMVLVRDAEGRIFTHRRSPDKTYGPGTYDVFVGGVVGAGESYAEAAVREAEEELGVRGISTEPLFRFLFETPDYSWFCDVHQARWTGPVSPQVEEIDWHGWLTEAEIAERLADGEWTFVPDGREAYRRFLLARG
ncbi:NUDIX domain-containing protein [Kitasatospora sp. NBC_01287]|uniref:NUDIX domain-containing protein n=1 Tax=Kitasatospora sp. NBC_01287 TaxID=2903573 RepID=UPI00225B0FA1|nr:NUDIX domain-containing protein [Kitasatospora sp. NBC_01287]MCX4750639.1 NUDIX domain-containing protein [Kitasatospora sp. NBC_01287]